MVSVLDVTFNSFVEKLILAMVAMFDPFTANNGSLAQPTEFFLPGLFTFMLLNTLAHYK